jgi:DNA processing protein
MPLTDPQHARLFLLYAAEPPAPAVHDFVAAHGPIDAVERIRGGTAPPAVLAEITRPDPQLDDALRAIDAGTANLVTPEDDDWPFGRLAGMAGHDLGAPLALWTRGSASLAELTRTAVTVTGTAVSTGYGSTVAADLAYELAQAGVTILSGGAFGIDESALRGALNGDSPPVVVLPCGVDLDYPMAHTRLFAEIVRTGGLLVSEYPLGALPTRARFIARRRLLAALAAATVIVEAGPRSAALTTARAARHLGRRVYGVPGPITSAASAGVNELLRTGDATAIGSVDHITYQEGLR